VTSLLKFLGGPMPLERSDIEEALEKKGFSRSQGDHRFFTYWTIEGVKTSVWTKTSHGTQYKTIGDNLVRDMAKQCGLTSPQFKELINCPLNRSDYESILIGNGRIVIKKAAEKSKKKGR
jgi:predicted RNA binding protein YcfA (HicA-like mRNA interferase family)